MKYLLAVRDVGVFKFKTKKERDSVIKDLGDIEYSTNVSISRGRPRQGKEKKEIRSIRIEASKLKKIEERYGKLQKFLDESLKEEMLKDD